MSREVIQYLVLDRCDRRCNMARYYALTIEPTLFGDFAFIREWGRIGRPGQRRVEFLDSPTLAMEELDTWIKRKCRKGYSIRE
ncbi:WGR domain-containing protein [Microvirga alba]|uniref:WGR domain-containing protein n=1 Tax=Microvirga alba TaxID=2791025 RepID=A0A931BVW4_9HYPH|nr:WGR domain-containing protein [Microvirga alba]MBF9235694.1 WGR domain-containing protein [Microvirga alba]